MTKNNDIKSQLANEALELIHGKKMEDYGAPSSNFARIANFWQSYFLNTGRRIQVKATDVAPMMRLLKEARLCENPKHRDSFVDLIGYTLLGAEINKGDEEVIVEAPRP